MIRRLDIHNFKLHANTRLPLTNLNILTGMNGMGKSSAIQSLLMLRESFRSGMLHASLNLRGESFNVGLSSALINWNPLPSDGNLLKFTLSYDSDDDSKECVFAYRYPEKTETRLPIEKDACRFDIDAIALQAPFNDSFQYLSAFRTGPRDSYGVDNTVVDDHRQISKSMGAGEYAVYFLEHFGNETIPVESLSYDRDDVTVADLSLKSQTEAWLNEIAPGTRLRIDNDSDKLKLKMAFRRHGKTPLWVDALNTGFGISYTLSVLVAVLSAHPGALILIENPEAHIHPAAQSGLMRLISKAAAAGVQFIIETHSDHIVNGALVGIKRGITTREMVNVYFFTRHPETADSLPLLMEINEECRIASGPKGFFTQLQSDMETLFGFDDE